MDTSYVSDDADHKFVTDATIHIASNTDSILTISMKQTICADSSMSADCLIVIYWLDEYYHCDIFFEN